MTFKLFLTIFKTILFSSYLFNNEAFTTRSISTPTLSTTSLFIGADTPQSTLTDGLQSYVKKMNRLMTQDFFDSSASLKTLHRNTVKSIEIKESSIQGAGNGLFAKKNIKANTIISFYPAHALGIENDGAEGNESLFSYLDSDKEYFQNNPSSGSCYLHCTDQPLFKRSSILSVIENGSNDIPLYLDVNPHKQVDSAWVSQFINDGATVQTNSEKGVLDYYKATKLTKNCIHIPWGPSPIMATVTTKKVKKGEELFTSYGGTYWLGEMDVRGDEGVGITDEIQEQIKDTAYDLLKSIQMVSVLYATQSESLEKEFGKL